MKDLDVSTLVRSGSIVALVDTTGRSYQGLVDDLLRPPGHNSREWSMAARSVVCVVPKGAPVWLHRSASDNVRFICELAGAEVSTPSAIRDALRLADVPDCRMEVKGSALSRFERLAVWLAVHRLRGTGTLLVEEPTMGLVASQILLVARLLREAVAGSTAVVISTADSAFAASVADSVVTFGRVEL